MIMSSVIKMSDHHSLMSPVDAVALCAPSWTARSCRGDLTLWYIVLRYIYRSQLPDGFSR